MSYPISEIKESDFPKLLYEIPQPPKKLYHRGILPAEELILLSVVGSRRYTNYGHQVTEHLISGLAGYNVGIVSGLALGIDSLAHEAAIANQLYTLAIPGGGLDDSVIYPSRHKPLARKILDSGGGLLSEYEPLFKATTWSFPERNRLVCGIAAATLVVEAGEKSGSLITARLTTDYNRELLVVPGSIFSDNSKGTHQFLKLGATPVTSAADIVDVLRLEKSNQTNIVLKQPLSPLEEKILNMLSTPQERDTLIRGLGLPVSEVTIILMQMEMSGLIKESGGLYLKL